MKEGRKGREQTFIAYTKAPIMTQPGKYALHDPAPPVALQLLAILMRCPLMIAVGGNHRRDDLFHVAVLLESLDRVDHPAAFLRSVSQRLVQDWMIFVTALICSGFDMVVLGLRNLYLYPPDRTNCFSLRGLEMLLTRTGFTLLAVSTPGVLDVEIVQSHLRHDPSIPISIFERQLVNADERTHASFQEFLQLGRKQP